MAVGGQCMRSRAHGPIRAFGGQELTGFGRGYLAAWSGPGIGWSLGGGSVSVDLVSLFSGIRGGQGL
jgi:hypothetical protein